MSRTKRNNFTLSFEEFVSKPCYVTDIAQLLGEDPRTTQKRIMTLGEPVRLKEWGQKYSPKQILYIFSKVGYSSNLHQQRVFQHVKKRNN